MVVLRFLLIALVVLSTSWAGASAAGHALSGGQDVAVTEQVAPLSGHAVCCDGNAAQSTVCQILLAIAPETDVPSMAPSQRRAVSFGSPVVLDGVEPAALLDPPRPV